MKLKSRTGEIRKMTFADLYVLNNDHTVRRASMIEEMHGVMKIEDRIVGKTQIEDILVSTVFLQVDHNLSGDGPPLLFETMIFKNREGKSLADYQIRCSTWEEALLMHENGIKKANEILLLETLRSEE